MRKYSERYILDVMKGKRRGLLATLVRSSLRILSWGYKLAASAHQWSFDNGWRRRYFPPVPAVISVGNIVAGGTGKTPIILKLAKELYKDHHLAILARGYKSPAEKLSSPIALCVGRGPVYPSSYSGDEPYLLAENLPEASIYVGKDRKKASIQAAHSGAEVILLDDGMQHRHLARDIEIVAINGTDPLGQGYFLPRGLLRESPKGLKRAHLIIVNHAGDRAQYLTAKHQIARYTDAPVVAMMPEMSALSDLRGNKIYALNGKKVGMFCGIANPQLFRKLLEEQGATVISELITADHTAPKTEYLQRFANECLESGAECLICTEKDKVKLVDELKMPLPILWVQLELKITDGQEHWDALITNIRNRINRVPKLQGAAL